MSNNFPTIGQYNLNVLEKGSASFNTLNRINLLPSRNVPFKYYLFGSGAFAVVFKGSIDNKLCAIRCFLSTQDDTISRYKIICSHLKNINASWKTECVLIENEININNKSFPVLKMDWVNGLLINEFVTQNLSNNNVLRTLQIKLVELSESLELNKIGHGDLQSGNIIIIGTPFNFQIKLIDFDGMYVPELANKNSIEKGRSEFQHPKRTAKDFNAEMDRFSFWVMNTALEALQYDKTLWKEVMQGGFNNLDNFLFTIQDFLKPIQSTLFNRLIKINSPSLNFYVSTLKAVCNGTNLDIPKPSLYFENSKHLSVAQNLKTYNTPKFQITTNCISAFVLSSSFTKLGSTPLELDKNTYEGKVILVSNGKETKRIMLYANLSLVEVKF